MLDSLLSLTLQIWTSPFLADQPIPLRRTSWYFPLLLWASFFQSQSTLIGKDWEPEFPLVNRARSLSGPHVFQPVTSILWDQLPHQRLNSWDRWIFEMGQSYPYQWSTCNLWNSVWSLISSLGSLHPFAMSYRSRTFDTLFNQN